MTDYIDRACALEEMQRANALARQADRAEQNYPSAFECEECGEPIPEARRQGARVFRASRGHLRRDGRIIRLG